MDKLECLLQKAIDDPSYRDQFYRTLLEWQVAIPHNTPPDQLTAPGGFLREGASLSLPMLEMDGVKYVPIFSSPQLLSAFFADPVPYVQMTGRDFFKTVKSHIVLNPGPYAKELSPDEIEAIMSDVALGSRSQKVFLDTNDEVFLGQPDKYPTQLVEALKARLADMPLVKSAYLALCLIQADGTPPHLAIGVDCGGNFGLVYQELTQTVVPLLPDGDFVDFIPIEVGGTIAEYMLHKTKPFYERKEKGGFFKKLFGE